MGGITGLFGGALADPQKNLEKGRLQKRKTSGKRGRGKLEQLVFRKGARRRRLCSQGGGPPAARTRLGIENGEEGGEGAIVLWEEKPLHADPAVKTEIISQ